MDASITIRIYLKTFNRLKKAFPAEREEAMASYFMRLADYMEKKQ